MAEEEEEEEDLGDIHLPAADLEVAPEAAFAEEDEEEEDREEDEVAEEEKPRVARRLRSKLLANRPRKKTPTAAAATSLPIIHATVFLTSQILPI